MSVLQARLAARRGAFALEVEFELAGAGMTSVFGASGAGKTTLLRCLAGLEPVSTGTLVVRGETWQDSAARAFRPPWQRRVGYVFQEAGLFAHTSVRGNLLFGYRRTPRRARRIEPDVVIEGLGLGALLARRPPTLSGGERQRVAIGRALLRSPRLLLMDEPLAALDEGSRALLYPFLEMLPARLDLPVLWVSHSLREVARLCERMLWLENGRIRAHGPTTELASSVDLALAGGEGIGAVLEARVRAHWDADHLTELEAAGGSLFVRKLERAVGRALRVQIPARDVSLALDPEPRSSILNVLRCAVVDAHAAGPGQVTVRLRAGGEAGPLLLARITQRSHDALGIAPGVAVYARIKSVGLLE